MTRPYPPPRLTEHLPRLFVPAPELEEWARRQFISELSPIYNEEHAHLQGADIKFLWTNVDNVKRGRRILGTCQLVKDSGDKWSAGRALMQLEEWFGDLPDFLITIYAPAAAEMKDASFMALVEHELYHAGQELDAFGSPKFDRQGNPVFGMRSHDVEEFVGVVRRYGASAAGIDELVRVANKGPEIGDGLISRACGSCLRLVKG